MADAITGNNDIGLWALWPDGNKMWEILPETKCGNIEIRNKFFLTLLWKLIFKTWCSTTQKRQKLATEMHHKSYSLPQWHNDKVVDRSWFCFSPSQIVFIVLLVDWCTRIRLNVRISLSEKESSTWSTLLSTWGATIIQSNI